MNPKDEPKLMILIMSRCNFLPIFSILEFDLSVVIPILLSGKHSF